MKNYPTELQIAFTGILAISILETIAISKGINGVMFGSAMAGIGGIVGWVFKGYHKNRHIKEVKNK